jgi:hypothetical protein
MALNMKADPKPDMRPEMRDESPRAAAERRAAEIMGHVDFSADASDDFYIAPDMVPDGWTYEWKRKTVYNQEDPAYQIQLARMGWTPVPASRHPEMMPSGWQAATIERKGQTLMERPEVITDRVKAKDKEAARNQVRIKEAQLNSAPDGQFGREHPNLANKVKKSYSPMVVPE